MPWAILSARTVLWVRRAAAMFGNVFAAPPHHAGAARLALRASGLSQPLARQNTPWERPDRAFIGSVKYYTSCAQMDDARRS